MTRSKFAEKVGGGDEGKFSQIMCANRVQLNTMLFSLMVDELIQPMK